VSAAARDDVQGPDVQQGLGWFAGKLRGQRKTALIAAAVAILILLSATGFTWTSVMIVAIMAFFVAIALFVLSQVLGAVERVANVKPPQAQDPRRSDDAR